MTYTYYHAILDDLYTGNEVITYLENNGTINEKTEPTVGAVFQHNQVIIDLSNTFTISTLNANNTYYVYLLTVRGENKSLVYERFETPDLSDPIISITPLSASDSNVNELSISFTIQDASDVTFYVLTMLSNMEYHTDYNLIIDKIFNSTPPKYQFTDTITKEATERSRNVTLTTAYDSLLNSEYENSIDTTINSYDVYVYAVDDEGRWKLMRETYIHPSLPTEYSSGPNVFTPIANTVYDFHVLGATGGHNPGANNKGAYVHCKIRFKTVRPYALIVGHSNVGVYHTNNLLYGAGGHPGQSGRLDAGAHPGGGFSGLFIMDNMSATSVSSSDITQTTSIIVAGASGGIGSSQNGNGWSGESRFAHSRGGPGKGVITSSGSMSGGTGGVGLPLVEWEGGWYPSVGGVGGSGGGGGYYGGEGSNYGPSDPFWINYGGYGGSSYVYTGSHADFEIIESHIYPANADMTFPQAWIDTEFSPTIYEYYYSSEDATTRKQKLGNGKIIYTT